MRREIPGSRRIGIGLLVAALLMLALPTIASAAEGPGGECTSSSITTGSFLVTSFDEGQVVWVVGTALEGDVPPNFTFLVYGVPFASVEGVASYEVAATGTYVVSVSGDSGATYEMYVCTPNAFPETGAEFGAMILDMAKDGGVGKSGDIPGNNRGFSSAVLDEHPAKGQKGGLKDG